MNYRFGEAKILGGMSYQGPLYTLQIKLLIRQTMAQTTVQDC